jgi:hypothetical protein
MGFTPPTPAENARLFDEAEPDQHGNVYERIKFLVRAIEEGVSDCSHKPDAKFTRLYHELVNELDSLQDGPSVGDKPDAQCEGGLASGTKFVGPTPDPDGIRGSTPQNLNDMSEHPYRLCHLRTIFRKIAVSTRKAP